MAGLRSEAGKQQREREKQSEAKKPRERQMKRMKRKTSDYFVVVCEERGRWGRGKRAEGRWKGEASRGKCRGNRAVGIGATKTGPRLVSGACRGQKGKEEGSAGYCRCVATLTLLNYRYLLQNRCRCRRVVAQMRRREPTPSTFRVDS